MRPWGFETRLEYWYGVLLECGVVADRGVLQRGCSIDKLHIKIILVGQQDHGLSGLPNLLKVYPHLVSLCFPFFRGTRMFDSLRMFKYLIMKSPSSRPHPHPRPKGVFPSRRQTHQHPSVHHQHLPITKSQTMHNPSTRLPPLRDRRDTVHSSNSEKEPFSPNSGTKVKQWQQLCGESKLAKSKLSRKVLNLLYLEESKDINPFIETLHQICNNKDKYAEEERDRVRDLCYMGLGKNLVAEKKVSVPPYSRVNLLIREFMIDVIAEEIKELQRRHPGRIYIRCNARGLGFQTRVFNRELESLMSRQEFDEVIHSANRIIQKEFIGFKKKKEIEVSKEIKTSLCLSVLGILLLVFYVQLYNSLILMALALAMVVASVILIVASLILRERGLYQNHNIIDQIQRKLVSYLCSLSSQPQGLKCRWRCGKDFYWLEISPRNQL